MRKTRRYYSAQEKVGILRKHLLEKVPVSELCDQHELRPTVFYRWQKQFFEQGERAFESRTVKSVAQGEEKQIAALKEKLQIKNEVLSEVMEEYVTLKKKIGGS